jgi:hypothetical protein
MSRVTRNISLAAIAGVLAYCVFAFSRLKVTPPAVDVGTLRIVTVKRGSMLLENRQRGDVLCVERPAHAIANSAASVFKLIYGDGEAQRVTVRFGFASGSTIEVLDGLKEDDQIILTDMSAWDDFDRIRLG